MLPRSCACRRKHEQSPHGDDDVERNFNMIWHGCELTSMGGALENSDRGVWHLTALGKAMSDEELRGLWKRIVANKENAGNWPTQNKLTTHEKGVPDERNEEPEIPWKERLLDILLAMDAKAFERLCQRLLRESGFIKVEITGRSGDGGIDGVGVLRVKFFSRSTYYSNARNGKIQLALRWFEILEEQWWAARTKP